MLSIDFDPVTNTNTTATEYPPRVLINRDLKKCFLDAATIFNAHYALYPNKWNTATPATGSAYLNAVTLLYVNRRFKYTSIASKDMHKVSRYLYQVATDYYSAEVNTLADSIPFSVEAHCPWEYTTRGFQYLRNYNLVEYVVETRTADASNLLGFCKERKINLTQKEDTVEVRVKKEDIVEVKVKKEDIVEVKVKKVLSIGGTPSLTISEDTLSVDSLDMVELATIATQLQETPLLLKKLLALKANNGPVS
jgi:hypothetical protein